jgi:hypothetical protein
MLGSSNCEIGAATISKGAFGRVAKRVDLRYNCVGPFNAVFNIDMPSAPPLFHPHK